ncbi:MAG: hypothetical protein RL701_5374 [Pseudomonadota bacterium]|jgi:hypothetical protein
MHARLRFILMGIAIVSVGLASAPVVTHAQTAPKLVEADFKGAVGLGLIGAELGAVIPALAGLDAPWAYIVFPVVGAAGGALAGYFALDKPGNVGLSIGALTLGMALVVPAFVVTLSATAYDGGDVETAHTRTRPAQSGYAAAASRPSQFAQVSRAENRRRKALRDEFAAGPGFVRVVDGSLALATPAFAILPGTRSNGELRFSGVSVSLMSGRF